MKFHYAILSDEVIILKDKRITFSKCRLYIIEKLKDAITFIFLLIKDFLPSL